MADRPEAAPEGWQVPQRAPMIAAALVPLVLLAALLGLGHLYDVRLRPQTHVAVQTFPAPGIDTYIHDGGRDPERPRPHPAPDPAVERAKRAVAAQGLAGWPR